MRRRKAVQPPPGDPGEKNSAWFEGKIAELRAELAALLPDRRALAMEVLDKEEERPN